VLAGAQELALLSARARESGASGGEEAAAFLLSGQARAVVVSRGADGAEVRTADGVTQCRALPVTVVDTVGAGDALCAGFVSGLVDGLDPAAALERGVRTAAFSVATAGDWEGLPRRDELDLLALDDGDTVR
jgi:2-dehydro-3-deoxygluconokinase